MKRSILAAALFSVIIIVANISGGATLNVDQPAVCYTCHEEIQDLQDMKRVHGAFAMGECSSCHNPHASKHASLLNKSLDATCFACHDDVQLEVALSHQHQPAANGECLSCHDPHASNFKGILKQQAGDLCISCHETANEWLAQKNVHAPVVSRDCTTCHDSHGSKYIGLMKKAMPAVCFDCHDDDAAFKRTHKGYDLAAADCGACHDPHSSSSAGLLMANQHAPFKAGDCSSCHSRDANAGGSFAIAGNADDACYTCHEELKMSKKEKFARHLEADGSCSNCHNPHASNASALLSSNQEQLCMKCHFTDVSSGDKPKFVTHEGQDCTICHAPHGAANEMCLANDNLMDLCNTCHASAHKNSHPMGEKTIDPRSGKPLDCLSCHKMHGSDHEFYLAFDADMDLCIQCHKR
jgi:predicted CXXCH cytochrome family protein